MNTNTMSTSANLTDGYKIGHRPMYPKGTELVFSNLTARKSRIPGVEKTVFFGLQYFVKKYLIEEWNKNFFSLPKEQVLKSYKRRIDNYLGVGAIGYDHIEALHDLGYLPIEIRAVKEGILVDIKTPSLVIWNTLPEFFWLTNYFETILSCIVWQPITSATTANEYKKILNHFADLTVGNRDFVPFQGHDFSFRGMPGLEAAQISGAAHLLSFVGSDTVPAIDFLEKYYNANCEKELIGCSVPACYDVQTEILSENGWKLFKDLKPKEKVAQYHEDGTISFVVPTEYYSMSYKGKMVEFKSKVPGYRYVDMLVTPNHRMIKRMKKTGELKIFEADNNSYGTTNQVLVSGKIKEGSGLTPVEQLKIAFQADGSFMNRAKSYSGKRTGKFPIRFSLKKERKAERLTKILDTTGFEYTKNLYEDGYYSFYVKCDEQFIKDLSWINFDEVSLNWINEFIEELSHWDGCKLKDRKRIISYSSTNSLNIDVVQALCSLSGNKSITSSYDDKRTDYNRNTNFNILMTKGKEFVGGDNVGKSLVDYDSTVHCVSVPTKMLVVRRNGVVAISGNTEHSIMCMGSKDGEIETFERLLDQYPTGILSVVSDTWDFWQVVTEFLPKLKDKIMARDGKLVIRPDSGDPVKIICGDRDAETGTPEYKGLIECLAETFGTTETKRGFKQLESHIGAIYGDSITVDRATEICLRLKQKRFASTNVVFGIGSYTYQYVTRDTYGFAVKATAGQVEGKLREIFKDPKTDDGTKKSAKGLLCLKDGKFTDCSTWENVLDCDYEPVFRDGKLLRDESLKDIRELLASQIG